MYDYIICKRDKEKYDFVENSECRPICANLLISKMATGMPLFKPLPGILGSISAALSVRNL